MQKLFYVTNNQNITIVLQSVNHINEFIGENGKIISVTAANTGWLIVAEK